MYNTITLNKEGKLIAFEAPEKPEYIESSNEFAGLEQRLYNERLQAAIDNGVEFKPFALLNIIVTDKWEKCKHYPVPDGYEIEIDDEIVSNGGKGHGNFTVYHAILVPKQEPVNLYPYLLIPDTQKQATSIEECNHKNRTWIRGYGGQCIDCGEKFFLKAKPTSIERNWTDDFIHENGNYQNECIKCHNLFMGHKHRVICKACSVSTSIEEAAEKYAEGLSLKSNVITDFIAGAKHQESKMFTKEDLMAAYDAGQGYNHYYDQNEDGNQLEKDNRMFEKWFEQFKQEKKWQLKNNKHHCRSTLKD